MSSIENNGETSAFARADTIPFAAITPDYVPSTHTPSAYDTAIIPGLELQSQEQQVRRPRPRSRRAAAAGFAFGVALTGLAVGGGVLVAQEINSDTPAAEAEVAPPSAAPSIEPAPATESPLPIPILPVPTTTAPAPSPVTTSPETTPAATQPTETSVVEETPAAAPVPPEVCDSGEPTVWDGGQLQAAMTDAAPGDIIVMADGMYEAPPRRGDGRPGAAEFILAASGGPEEPVVICGSDEAVILGAPANEYALVLEEGISHVQLYGFSVQGPHGAIQAEGVSDTVIQVHTAGNIPAEESSPAPVETQEAPREDRDASEEGDGPDGNGHGRPERGRGNGDDN